MKTFDLRTDYFDIAKQHYDGFRVENSYNVDRYKRFTISYVENMQRLYRLCQYEPPEIAIDKGTVFYFNPIFSSGGSVKAYQKMLRYNQAKEQKLIEAFPKKDDFLNFTDDLTDLTEKQTEEVKEINTLESGIDFTPTNESSYEGGKESSNSDDLFEHW